MGQGWQHFKEENMPRRISRIDFLNAILLIVQWPTKDVEEASIAIQSELARRIKPVRRPKAVKPEAA